MCGLAAPPAAAAISAAAAAAMLMWSSPAGERGLKGEGGVICMLLGRKAAVLLALPPPGRGDLPPAWWIFCICLLVARSALMTSSCLRDGVV